MPKFMTRTVLIGSLLIILASSGSALSLGSLSNERAVKAQEAAKTRLEGTKLRACESREKVVNNILDRIARRGEKRLDVYNKIYQRVQDFYVKKGLSISNYDQLIIDANAKKATAQTSIDTIKNKQVEFGCDGSDPKGVASGFKVDLKAQIKALHDYQQSIKNLIVAVKTGLSTSAQTGSNSGEGEQ